MSSDIPLNRRFFFRNSVVSFLDCVCNESRSNNVRPLLDEENNRINLLWSDFTPEMIEFEAKRLSLDPKDKEDIFRRIQQEMLDAKTDL